MNDVYQQMKMKDACFRGGHSHYNNKEREDEPAFLNDNERRGFFNHTTKLVNRKDVLTNEEINKKHDLPVIKRKVRKNFATFHPSSDEYKIMNFNR